MVQYELINLRIGIYIVYSFIIDMNIKQYILIVIIILVSEVFYMVQIKVEII